MGNRKKLKDTKLGQWLKEKAPQILDVVGDVLPDKGVLGIVKNLIDSSDNLTPEDKAAAHERTKELYSLEVEDRDSARTREAEIAKTDRIDFMFNATGVVGLLAFIFVIYAITYLTIPEANKEAWYQLIGLCEGVVISIFAYYFGSSSKKHR